MRSVFGLAVFAGLAVAAGASFVVQASVNARLRAELASPNWAALASYAGGTLVMALVLLATRESWLSAAVVQRVPWWAWTGGLWGAIYVVIVIVLLPRLGTAPTVALFVLGQMVASLAFDRIGLFGVPKHPIDAARVLGTALLVAGVVLIRR